MNSNKRNARIAMRRKAGYSLDEIMSEYEYITGHKCDEDTALEIKSIVESSGAYLSEVIEEYATLSCEGRLALVAQNRRSALNKKAGYYGPYVVDTPVGQLNAYIDDEEGVWSWMVDAGDGSLWDFDSHGFDTFEEAKADLFGKYVVLSESDAKVARKKFAAGFPYTVVKEIDPSWSGYDKSVAQGQLATYGEIYVDEYGMPIDDEYALMEIEDERGVFGSKKATKKVAFGEDYGQIVADIVDEYVQYQKYNGWWDDDDDDFIIDDVEIDDAIDQVIGDYADAILAFSDYDGETFEEEMIKNLREMGCLDQDEIIRTYEDYEYGAEGIFDKYVKQQYIDSARDAIEELRQERTAGYDAKHSAKKTAAYGDYGKFREPRFVQTGLYGDKNYDILASVIGQMSDGYYENDPYWNRYWKYCEISRDNEIVVEDGDWSSGFRGMSDSEVCHLFAKVIKNVMNRVFRDGWDDVPKSEFPVSQERCVYFDYDSGATYADVYNAMQELKNK